MEHVLRRPRRPRPGRRQARHQRRPPRAGRGDRGEPARRRRGNAAGLTTPPTSCPPAPSRRGRRSKRCCTASMTSPTPKSVHAQYDKLLDAMSRATARRARTPRRKPAPTSSPSRRSRRNSGARSGRTTPTNASTARSAAAPTSSASSPTATPSPASSAPSWPNNTTNGSKAAATSALDVLARAQAIYQVQRSETHETTRAGDRSLTNPDEDQLMKDRIHHVQGLDRVPRSRGAASGLLLLLLGAWGFLIPLVGPYVDFGYSPTARFTSRPAGSDWSCCPAP